MAERLEPGEETCVHVNVAGRLYEIWIGAPAVKEPTLDIALREEMPGKDESRFIAQIRIELP